MRKNTPDFSTSQHKILAVLSAPKSQFKAREKRTLNQREIATISLVSVLFAAPGSIYIGYPFMTLNTLANRQKWPTQSLQNIALDEDLFKHQHKPSSQALRLIFKENWTVAALLMRGVKTVSVNGVASKGAFMGPPMVIDAISERTAWEPYAFPVGLVCSSVLQGGANFHARKAHLYESYGVQIKTPIKYFWQDNFSLRCLSTQIAYFIWASGFTLGGMKLGEAFWRERCPEYYDVLGSLTALPFVQVFASPANVVATRLMSPDASKLSIKAVVKSVNFRGMFTTRAGLIPLATMTAWKVVENGALRVFALRTKTMMTEKYEDYLEDTTSSSIQQKL